jgi:pimeloyl-ACP methyl ester carboxylesterase
MGRDEPVMVGRCGHFAPFEEPELYAEDLRAFYRAATG